MAGETSIKWAEKTWNPLAGCSVVSPACTNCYAMAMAARIVRMSKGRPTMYDGTTTETAKGKHVWTGQINVAPDHQFLAPLRWRKPSRIFVNSMSDVFHNNVPDDVIDRIFAVMALCPQHTFMILTKRPQRMREYCAEATRPSRVAAPANVLFHGQAKVMMDNIRFRINVPGKIHVGTVTGFKTWPLPNVWLGVTCEDQGRADERIPDLLNTPAAVRFVSAEPLLSRINFRHIDMTRTYDSTARMDALGGDTWLPGNAGESSTTFRHPKLDLIITGGESGPERRNIEHVVDHIADIDRQCQAAGVAHFVKQDAAFRDGQQGRIPDWLWARKQLPEVKR